MQSEAGVRFHVIVGDESRLIGAAVIIYSL